jgi:alpha-ketoglutarate-dependent taurine dioxygenase
LLKQEAAVERKKDSGAFARRFMEVKPKSIEIGQDLLVKTATIGTDNPLPLVIEPNDEDVDLIEWAGNNREYIDNQLLSYGAILFRDFKIGTAQAFEQMALRLLPELLVDNGEHNRYSVSPGVYTPVDYPADQFLLWHNENSFNYEWPTKIWFYCHSPAEAGGETPIVDSRRVYEGVPTAIKERFKKKGVMYVRRYGTGLGLSWERVFQTADRVEVERRCRQSRMEFTWREGNRLTTRCVRPAAVVHPRSREAVWFNQAQHWHLSCLVPEVRAKLLTAFAEEDLPRNCFYGDGAVIEDSVMGEILEVYESLQVSFQWERGDVLLLDNLLTAHGRNAFRGERTLYVAMGQMLDYSAVQPA